MNEDSQEKIEAHEEAPRAFVKKNISGQHTKKEEADKKRRGSGVSSKAVAAERTLRIETQLAEIYENGDGSMPDMQNFERNSGRTITAVVMLVLAGVFLGGVVWAGFFWFPAQSSFQQQDVVLTISGEESVTVGAPATYRIRYKNDQDTPLANAVLQVRYPDGFVYVSSSREPTKETHDEWSLGALKSGDSGYVDVTGMVYGDIGASQSFRVFLNYTPANFSSEFQKAATVTTKIGTSFYTISIDGPADVTPGSDAALTITVPPQDASTGVASTTAAIAIVVDPGTIFFKKSSEPASDKFEPYRWTILHPEKGARIQLRGSFTSPDAGAVPTLTVRIVGKKPGDTTGDSFTFQSATFTPTLALAPVGATLVVNGASSDSGISPGQKVQATVVVKNAGAEPLTNVRVRVSFDAPSVNKKSLLDWTNLEDVADGTVTGEQLSQVLRRGTISWDKKQIKELAKISPNTDVTIDVSLPVKDTDAVDFSAFPPGDIIGAVEVQYDHNGTTDLVSGNHVTLYLASDTALNVRDTVTPVEGGETHRVSWVLTNSIHPLKDVRLEVDVYGDVAVDTVTLVAPVGTATFDSANKKLVWTVADVPLKTTTLTLPITITLKNKNTSQSQLSSKVRGSATDAVTGRQVTFVGDPITLK